MLSISSIKSANSAGHYFSKDNYYAKDSIEEKQASQWFGKTAQAFKLEGHVESAIFTALLEGKIPIGEQLGIMKEGERHHRPGYDLTFSAPKTVSLLALIGGDQRLLAAHQEAVKNTMAIIETELASARVTQKGKTAYEKTGNLLVALFTHDTSRALEPQLHTHAVIINATVRGDGTIRALSSQQPYSIRSEGLQGFNEQLYHRKMHFGAVYRLELAKIVVELGYGIKQTHQDGQFEIVGIGEFIVKKFSTRRHDIVEFMMESKMSGGKQAELAALITREAKGTVSRDDIKQHWDRKVRDLNFSTKELIDKSIERQLSEPVLSPEKRDSIAKDAIEYASQHLSEREAVFTHDALFATAKSHSLGILTHSDLQAALGQAYETGTLLHATMMDGHQRATTQAALDLENSNITYLKEGVEKVTPFMSSVAAEYVLMARALTYGQMDAAKLILCTSDRIIGVQGYAGTGKTTMLATVKELADILEIPIKGMAPTAAAANKLGSELGIECCTIDRFLLMQQNALAAGETPSEKALWLVDECSMLSSRRFNDLLALNQQSGAHLVLIGDKQQLAAIEAGKPFEQLQRAGMQIATMLDIIRQQKGSALYQSVHHAIEGDIGSALQKIQQNIHEIPEKEERLTQLVQDYLVMSKEEREKTLVITPANHDRDIVNQHIRQGLQREGSLARDAGTFTALHARGLTLVEQKRVMNYQVGDWVVFHKNSQTFQLERKQYYQVVSINADTNSLQLVNNEGKKIAWQPHRFAAGVAGGMAVYREKECALAEGEVIRWRKNDYSKGFINAEKATVVGLKGLCATVRLANHETISLDLSDKKNQHWDYAYASTVYSAQGESYKNVLAHEESFREHLTNQRAFYVIISRAQGSVALYIDDKQRYQEQLERVIGEKTSSLESLLQLPKNIAQEEKTTSVVSATANLNKSMESFTKPPENLPSLFYDIDRVQYGLTQKTEHVVEKLLGEPNHRLSNQHQWRYGKKGSLVVSMTGEKRGVWHNFETGEGGHLLQLIQREMVLPFKESLSFAATLAGISSESLPIIVPSKSLSSEKSPLSPSPDDLKSITKAQQLWQQTKSIEDTLAERYLREHRGITLEKLPASYRFLPSYRHHQENKLFPALVVAATNEKGKVQAVQVICLDEETANKAAIDVNKVTQGRMRFGALVSLNEAGKSDKLYFAEGPETALSILNAEPDAKVMAALSISNFHQAAAFAEAQTQLILCADNDKDKTASLEKLSPTLAKLGEFFQEVRVAMPDKTGQDFNDVHRSTGLDGVKNILSNAIEVTKNQQAFMEKFSQNAAEKSVEAAKFFEKMQTKTADISRESVGYRSMLSQDFNIIMNTKGLEQTKQEIEII